MRSALRFSILSVLILVFFSSCKKEELSVPVEPKPNEQAQSSFLVSYEEIGSVSRKKIVEQANHLIALSLARYDVRLVKIVYNTRNTDGTLIKASGLFLLPEKEGSISLLSLQHGTITDDKLAPSWYNPGSEVYGSGSVMASFGFAVSAPDYIGYGASANLPHPYEHAQSLATASRDMLRAVKEFCQLKSINIDSKLFITGYSEGGYASMALMKLLEEHHSSEFTITACAPGGGAYDKLGFAEYILKKDEPLSFLDTYLWVLDTYNNIYKLNRPYSFFLNEPYALQIEKNGLHANVETNPQLLFTEEFRKAILDGTDAELIQAIADNNIYDWKPSAPLRLFHGTDDDFVPFFNAQNAYNAMSARGASNVTLKPIEGGNHFTSVGKYAEGVILFFSQYM